MDFFLEKECSTNLGRDVKVLWLVGCLILVMKRNSCTCVCGRHRIEERRFTVRDTLQ